MSNRYPRDRSPPYRDRRPSTFGNGYPPRAGDSVRPNPEPSAFPPREIPRGPKSVVDTSRGPATGPPTPLRTAPPLSSGPAPPLHNSHNSWRADRDRDRDFDRRERRPTPPRRSPIRDVRDPRDQRDFIPRDLDVNRARRNSRDGPPSAGSTYSDAPPISAGSSYRGGNISRGRGGFAGRGRNFHNDDRDRHHDPRDRPPDRTYRPRSRTPPGRRERDVRDERDFDRRDRDDRRFIPREYDSYIGPAGAAKPGPRALDTHRGSVSSDLRHLPGTPTGPTPHSSHHASPSDRLGSQVDSYSRRSSLAMDPLSAKAREPGKDEALLASRAEASRERYAPRASSPPASIPAFGGSNVWRAPIPETKASVPTASQAKPVPSAPAPAPTPAAPISAAPTPGPATAPTPDVPTPAASTAPKAVVATPTPKVSIAPPASKTVIPSGPPVLPPTGPKADRVSDRVLTEASNQDSRPGLSVTPRKEPSSQPPPPAPIPTTDVASTISAPFKAPIAQTAPTSSIVSSNVTSSTSTPTAPSGLARSPPQGPAFKPRVPPIAPQAAFRANASPSFSRATLPPYSSRDPSPGAAPPIGPRSGGGHALAVNTSPQTLPANIPTGPKADRTPMAPRPSSMYPPPDRPGFAAPRAPMSGGPKSMQWVRPGLIPARPMIPTKREFPLDDRDRQFGTVPKAPRLENSISAMQSQREQAKSVSPSMSKALAERARPRERAASAERSTATSPKPTPIESRRYSDVVMAEASPRVTGPPMSTTSSAPEVLEDSDDDVDLDEEDFAESEAKYNREVARLEAKRIDLSAAHLRATTPLQEIVLLSCLTVDHLPQKQMESKLNTEDEAASVLQDDDNKSLLDQRRPESGIADLPTPKDDRSDDIEMGENDDKDDKLDRSTAPATIALRLRREGSANDDTLPDMSSLPYLGSGPPTPLSDIGQDRPSLSDSIKLAMREKLRKSIEPDLTQDETLRQYAATYRQWRYTIRPWDDERELDDPERQPSVEPTLKALTPDVQSTVMTGILDGSLAPTGRRGHASRWATELDIEAVIAESLKTAEEEKLGKKDKEPRKSLADPEKEADLPIELTDIEAQRRRYIDTNFQREPGQGIFAFHYEPPEDDFTEEEHRVMVHNYKDQFAKKWGKLAEVLYKEVGTERTYKDCINHYYATKWGREYKGKLRGKRAGPKKRGGAVARGRAAIANMERPEQSGEDGLPLPVTETGRPRRSAAPTFGGPEQEIDPNAAALLPGRARRQTDADGTQEKAGRRGKGKDKAGRKAKNMNMPIAAAPVGSPIKLDRKEKSQNLAVKLEDEFSKRPLGEMPLPIHAGLMEEQMLMASNQQILAELPPGMLDRSKLPVPAARPGPSSYWSVSELQDFDKNVAHFGTDWLAIANHMGTKTHTMIKNQYQRLVESGRMELDQMAKEADARRERGDEAGPPPTPTPAPKRRYESTQATPIRQIAPTPEHKSPLLNQLALPKATSPHSASSSRFSTIAQAPVQSKPSLPVSGYSSLAEPSLVPVPSMPLQQSPPAPLQRAQPHHHHQHSMSQHKPLQHGPRSGFFSDDTPPRHENRPPPQSPAIPQPPRHLQQHAQSQGRSQEQHHPSLYRGAPFADRENLPRSVVQQEPEAHQRFHQRRISHELQNARAFVPGQPALLPTVRSNSDLRSPEHRPLAYSHSRHVSQAQSIGHSSSDVYGQGPASMSSAQQLPPRSSILTPPVKEEPRNPPPFMPQPHQAHSQPQPQPQPMLHSQHQHQQLNQNSISKGPPPGPPKPVAEPRKSNLMSLLNDDTPAEEPRRKKTGDQGTPSHSTTPQQSTPIAPPPPTSQPYPSSSRRSMYDDPGAAQSTYSRPSYAQQSALPPSTTTRSIDLANEQSGGGRPREGWPQRPSYLHSHSNSQHSVSLPSSQPGPQQTPFNDNRLFGNHRSMFAQHNAARHNPSPPPHGYSNSPHMHSRTPSISGVPGQTNRHPIPSSTAGQHSQGASASALILQPNPYAQVDPPGSAPSSGPMGMRPSPHLHTSHIAQQRDAPGRNEHSQTQNANLSYSNPQTPNEHPGHPQLGAPRGLNEPYRPRDPRDLHRDLESRNSDRDTGRELAQRSEYLEQLSNSAMRTAGPPLHEDLRYQPQDRPYLPQRSQTPLSRPEHSQTPQLQHPPGSSLGVANPPMFGQRSHEDPTHRFQQPTFQHDRSMADRIRDEQAQHQAAMEREEHLRRDRERNLRERQLQDAHYRDEVMRNRGIRGQLPPGSGPEQRPDPRAPTGPGPMDWNRHPQDRGGWQQQR